MMSACYESDDERGDARFERLSCVSGARACISGDSATDHNHTLQICLAHLPCTHPARIQYRTHRPGPHTIGQPDTPKHPQALPSVTPPGSTLLQPRSAHYGLRKIALATCADTLAHEPRNPHGTHKQHQPPETASRCAHRGAPCSSFPRHPSAGAPPQTACVWPSHEENTS